MDVGDPGEHLRADCEDAVEGDAGDEELLRVYLHRLPDAPLQSVQGPRGLLHPSSPAARTGAANTRRLVAAFATV